MLPTIDEVLYCLEDMNEASPLQKYFSNRENANLAVKTISVSFESVDKSWLARVKIDYDDSDSKLNSEDLNIVMERKGATWKVKSIERIDL